MRKGSKKWWRKVDGLTPQQVGGWMVDLGSPDLWEKLERLGAERGATHIDIAKIDGEYVAALRTPAGDVVHLATGRSRGVALVGLEDWLMLGDAAVG